MCRGVEIEHRSLSNFVQVAHTEYGINKDDRVLQFASISFDTAVEEIYPCLVFGGTLILRNEEMLSSVSKFMQTCQEWRITVLDLPTAYWQKIIAELDTSIQFVLAMKFHREVGVLWLQRRWKFIPFLETTMGFCANQVLRFWPSS
ncbi:MAG: AMP-binding protein [Okeania sp. SIO1I7]|nr:AMP-binding protein [Okeania sp. SIO1I7]